MSFFSTNKNHLETDLFDFIFDDYYEHSKTEDKLKIIKYQSNKYFKP